MIFHILIFIIILSLLIFVHEFGHFYAAKKSGIKVEEFGFGFPPRIFGIKRGETIYSLNLFPIGGFVKIYGEEGEGKNDKRSFSSKSVLTRAIVLCAGVIMNVFLAVILLSIGYSIGLPQSIEDNIENVKNPEVKIVSVSLNSPAEKAGIIAGDSIIQLRKENEKLDITKVKQVQDFINKYKGKEIIVKIKRENSILEKKLVPRENPPQNQGPIGVGLVRVGEVSYPIHKAILMGIKETVNLIYIIFSVLFKLLINLVTEGKLIGEIAGPVGIFVITKKAAKLGFIYLVQLTALISINLAIINILPFPALDGGRLLFLIIEKIKGKPVSKKAEKIAHSIGFAILIILMIIVTYRDILRFF
ncbi:RIP metalloprotease RseP [Candidatus Pacearchaeota archaeon]|nr:MAG: RIP metalloprotease RseP [Candidatus Pacearchaeota archaeon]